ncbi:hypothetical protein QFC19_006345 [Naganishia cerealis]|uniref:Uncharacterized protein n=1 Tax=Naganishia cerealis TaxID=610337 RepID=A0ACC2VHD3_9TREE|nr:hypothetical protein QFC19_006345 [Naganishia cerealis]
MPQSPRPGPAYRDARRHATSPLPLPGSSLRQPTPLPPRPSRSPLDFSAQPSYIPFAGPEYYYARPEQIYNPNSSIYYTQATPSSMSPDGPSHQYPSSPRFNQDNASRRPPSSLSFNQYGSRDESRSSPSVLVYQNDSGLASTQSGTGPGTPDESMQEPVERASVNPGSTEDEVTEESPTSQPGDLDDTQLSTSAKRSRKSTLIKTGPPRPPNAWILYRSEKLKAIAAGEKLLSLEEILAEQAKINAAEAGGSSRAPGVSTQKSGSQKPPPPGKGKGKQKGKKIEQPIETMEEQKPPTDTVSREDNASNKAIPQAEISKVISLMWKREKREEKAKYERMAEVRKAEHSLKYPDYKFHPMKREDKLRLKEEAQQERERTRKERMMQKARDKKKAAKPKPTVEAKEVFTYSSAPVEASSGRVQKKARKTTTARTEGHLVTMPAPLPPPVEGLQFRPEMEAPRNQCYEQVHWNDHQTHIYSTPKGEVPSPPNFFGSQSYVPRGYLDPALQFNPVQLSYSYSTPSMQPGFAVNNGEVVPYIFEPMPFGLISPQMGSSSRVPMMSSIEEPAVAMMAPAAYQPLGVSESELEEMWSLLQDDAIDQDNENNSGEKTMLLGEAWSGDSDSALAAWNNFGMPLNEAPVPVTQLSAGLGSRIASEWAGFGQPVSSTPIASDPITRQGYILPGPAGSAYVADPISQLSSQPSGSEDKRPRHMRIRVPPRGTQDGLMNPEQPYQGPLLSSREGLTPLGNSLPVGSYMSPSGGRSPAEHHPGNVTNGNSPQLIRERNSSLSSDLRMPTPRSPFAGQLSPPTYCDPALNMLRSRQPSVFGEPAFQWDTEDENRYEESYRVPSFADAVRIPSVASNFSNERDGHSYPYQYRDFSASSVGRRRVSAANNMPARDTS